MNTKDLTIESIKLKVLLYGKSGTGKTSFGCCFPHAFVADFDNGMLSQRGKDVDYEVYTGPAGYQKFEEKLKEFEANCPYETFVLDSITTMQEVKMDLILQQNRKRIPTQYEWMVLITDMKDLFTRITKIASHLVVVAHEMMMQDELTGEIMAMPVIYGKKLPAQLPLWFDEVMRAQVSRTKEGMPQYEMLTTADRMYTAKSRLGCLDNVMVWSREGKMLNAFDLIMGKIKESEGGEKK